MLAMLLRGMYVHVISSLHLVNVQVYYPVDPCRRSLGEPFSPPP